MKSVLIRMVLVPAALVAFALFVFLPSCSAVKEEARATAKSVVDCTTSTALQAIKEYAPTLEQVLIDSVAGDGKIDRDRVKSAAMSYASDTARCVFASTVARLSRPPTPSSPDAPLSSPLAIDRADLADAWSEIRTTQFGGATFKLGPGS